jgi:hypothetical protein
MKTDEKTEKTPSKTQTLQEILRFPSKSKISCSKPHQFYHQLFRPCLLFQKIQGLTPGFFFCYLGSGFCFVFSLYMLCFLGSEFYAAGSAFYGL